MVLENTELIINNLTNELIDVKKKLSIFYKRRCDDCGGEVNTTCGDKVIVDFPCGCCTPNEDVKIFCPDCGLKTYNKIFFERHLKRIKDKLEE